MIARFYNNGFLFLFVLVLFFLSNCGSTSKKNAGPFADCKYGKPTAIFNNEIPTVTENSFKIEGKEGLEKVIFEDGMELEIIQSGCNEVKQELFFRFKNKKFGSDFEMMTNAVQQLLDLGDLDEKLKAFTFWAQAVMKKPNTIKKGKALEVEPYTFVTIDQIDDQDDTIIWIILEQRAVTNQ